MGTIEPHKSIELVGANAICPLFFLPAIGLRLAVRPVTAHTFFRETYVSSIGKAAANFIQKGRGQKGFIDLDTASIARAIANRPYNLKKHFV